MSPTADHDDHPAGRPLFNDEALTGPQGGMWLGGDRIPSVEAGPDGQSTPIDPDAIRGVYNQWMADAGLPTLDEMFRPTEPGADDAG